MAFDSGPTRKNNFPYASYVEKNRYTVTPERPRGELYEDLDDESLANYHGSIYDYSSLSPSDRRKTYICQVYGQEHNSEIDDYEEYTNEYPAHHGPLSIQNASQYTLPSQEHMSLSQFSYPGSLDSPRVNHGATRIYSKLDPQNDRNTLGVGLELTRTPGIMDRGSNPRNTHGIRLRPVSSLPDIYRGLFKFGVFNAVQSSCFEKIMNSNENMVVSAPTGSGKTVLFELAIIKMLTDSRNKEGPVKCVYVAPTKALCSERYRDWTAKFDPLGVRSAELTGDTVHFGRGVWGDAKQASIIITTGEKWDSLTRNWRDHSQILSQIQLFLIDEVHVLNETRGSTLEVVVSRMRTHGCSIRFVLVSATVPNIQDIALWIGSVSERTDIPAKTFEFGEEFRPCKLARFVVGVPRPRGQNDFAFNKNLDYRLFAALQQYSVGKPILIFCSTRKGVFTTAEQLLKDYIEAENGKKILPWSCTRRPQQLFNDKRLAEFVSFGIGVHHAGLTIDDRRMIEDLYLKGILRVIVATSTLAVGVNLPAYMVVIKGVQTFQNNASVEYSDLDIMQMLGRAGRPQFDNDGIALILCEDELVSKYRALAQGKTILESSLHENLSEHLNSEIGLRTITSISTAKEWLRGSFLFQRIRKNPNHYALGKNDDQTWEDRVDDLVMQSVKRLQQTQLVETSIDVISEELKLTDYGDIMSKLYIRQSTMGLILALTDRPTLRELLEMISSSEEFSDTKLRASEKTGLTKALNKLRKHPDIRFEMKKLEKSPDKIFLLIQAVLGGISLNTQDYKSTDSQPQLEAFGIFRHVGRIARAIVEVGVYKQLGAQVKYGLELLRCLTAKAWEDRPVVLRQLEQIGEKSIKVLAEHGIVSIPDLLKQDSLRIEVLLNRRSPFGSEILTAAYEMPQYQLEISESRVTSCGGKRPVEIDLSIECGLQQPITEGKSLHVKSSKNRTSNMTVVLTMSSDMELFDYRRILTKSLREKKSFVVTTQLNRPSQSIHVLITSETTAGLVVTKFYKPTLPVTEFPMRNTRPQTSIDIDLAGLEDDPDFWDMNIDEKSEELIQPIRDLTKPKSKAEDEDNSLSHGRRSGKVLEAVDQHTVAWKKLPNGHLECYHPCKNKDKCRHLCCREGLPQKSKKRGSVTVGRPALEPPKRVNIQVPHAPAKQTITTCKASDSSLEQLESLHRRSSIAGNLKLPPGHRLKLGSPNKLKRKQKPTPNFRVEFMELKDPQGGRAMEYDVSRLEDDDDLPEAHEILKVTSRMQTSPETVHSNSDVDSLIRAIPLHDIEFHAETKSTPPSHQLIIDDVSAPRKRRRLSRSVGQVFQKANKTPFFQEQLSTPQNVVHDDPTRLSLFLPHSSDGLGVALDNRQRLIKPFNLGDSFDINHSETPPDLPQTISTISETEQEADDMVAVPLICLPLLKTRTEEYQPAGERKGAEDDFAELDAWLNSAAVEIL